MRVIGVIQARMSSSRLPGKVLKPLGGRPLLERMIQRVTRANHLGGIVVATSDQAADDAIVEFCRARGISYVRGPLEDVAQRFLLTMETVPADAYARLCADSPLMDPAVVDAVVEAYERAMPDLATNVYPRTFPAGLSVEVINPSTFRRAIARFHTEEQREHVTRFFYEHAEEFDIVNVANPNPRPSMDLSVNTEEQWRFICEVWDRWGPRWEEVSWQEIADQLSVCPSSCR